MGYFIALSLLLIIASLGAAGFFMLRRAPPAAQGDGDNEAPSNQSPESSRSKAMARALTLRIALSLVLFVTVLVAWQMGWITPTGLPLRG